MVWVLAAALLALIALGVSGYLSVQSLTGSAAAGCGGDDGCGAVLASPWSKVGSIPVSQLGAATYLAVLVALALRVVSQGKNKFGDFVLLAAAPAMLIAAVWFTYIQHFEIGEYCPYCMVDHGIGLLLGILLPIIVLRDSAVNPVPGIALGVLGVAVLIGVQFAAPADNTQRVDNPFVDRDGDMVIDGKRHVSMFGGELQIVLEEETYLGDKRADQVVGLVFDYACPHCRSLHEMLDQAIAEDPKRFVVVPIPLTIHESKNEFIASDNARFVDSHERATLSLAVAAIDRDKWKAFDHWLFSFDTVTTFPRTADEARTKAIELVGQAALDQQMTGENLAKHHATIERNIQLLSVLPKDNPVIPVVTAPGAPAHLTTRFFKIEVLEGMLAEADKGLKAAEAAETEP